MVWCGLLWPWQGVLPSGAQLLVLGLLTVAVIGLVSARDLGRRRLRQRIEESLRAESESEMAAVAALRPGSAVKILLSGTEDEPLQATVESVGPQQIVLGLPSRRRESPVAAGAPVVVFVSEGSEALRFQGTALEVVEGDHGDLLYLERPPWLARMRRRRSPRVTAEVPVSVLADAAGSRFAEPVCGILEDLSAGGFRLRLPSAFAERTVLCVSLRLPGGEETTLRSRVRRCQPVRRGSTPFYVVHCELGDVAQGTRDLIAQYVRAERETSDSGPAEPAL